MKLPRLRFGQGPQVRVGVTPQRGPTATTFLLSAGGLRPHDQASLILTDPRGSVITLGNYTADPDGNIGPVPWRAPVALPGSYQLTVAAGGRNERASVVFYLTG